LSATDHDWTRVYAIAPDGEVYSCEVEETDGDVEVSIPAALDRKAAIAQVEAILGELRREDALLSRVVRR
jgi:hypothetical protein